MFFTSHKSAECLLLSIIVVVQISRLGKLSCSSQPIFFFQIPRSCRRLNCYFYSWEKDKEITHKKNGQGREYQISFTQSHGESVLFKPAQIFQPNEQNSTKKQRDPGGP
ncbi:uncharacterized protein B0T23DRAFT_198899 [Neurospora hispaniola]|uniref:Secreted protein n=1 Tax=Neurospora hispaniola TaxID=588809 RepID=A0AAJ0I4C9_9PEZI|nr:hypothetical protein B0T23DRAFT_198899 [Neurospora hispaniola]